MNETIPRPNASKFWDALAPHHARIENNYFDLRSVRRIQHEIRSPVLIVGAGQGLIVAELRKNGFQCDGVDLSGEMLEYARRRRGLGLVQADARAMPFQEGAYITIIYATGVIDFQCDEDEIRVIMSEAKRIVDPAGTIFVAFYRISAATEDFLGRLGLLRNGVLSHRETLEIYRLTPAQAIAWVATKANVGYLRAAILSLRSWALSTVQEKKAALNMQRIFAKPECADSLITAAVEKQPYRTEAEIKKLFERLEIPIAQFKTLDSCFVVRIRAGSNGTAAAP